MARPAQHGAAAHEPVWRPGNGRELALDAPRLMGVLNVTPDSFSDGGDFYQPAVAVERGLRMIDEGAVVIDIGGESTRPGAGRISAEQQKRRVLPVIAELRRQSDVFISIDTTSADVAAAALEKGADVINDVSAGHDDERLFEVASQYRCGIVLMHRLRPPADDSYSDQYRHSPVYGDVVTAVRRFLLERAAKAQQAGINSGAIVLDPGLGFGKTVAQNYQLIQRTGELCDCGFPLLGAASRKSFVGRASGINEPAQRVYASLAVSVAQYLGGIRLFRVHDVAAQRQALAVAAAITIGEGG